MSWRVEKDGRVTEFGLEQVAHLSTEKEFKEFFEGKAESSELRKIWKEVKKGLGLKEEKPEDE